MNKLLPFSLSMSWNCCRSRSYAQYAILWRYSAVFILFFSGPRCEFLPGCSSLSEAYYAHAKRGSNIKKARKNLCWKIDPAAVFLSQPKGYQFGDYQTVNTCSYSYRGLFVSQSGKIRDYPHVPGMVNSSQSVESIEGRCLIPNISAETGAVACFKC